MFGVFCWEFQFRVPNSENFCSFDNFYGSILQRWPGFETFRPDNHQNLSFCGRFGIKSLSNFCCYCRWVNEKYSQVFLLSIWLNVRWLEYYYYIFGVRLEYFPNRIPMNAFQLENLFVFFNVKDIFIISSIEYKF